MTTWRRHVSLNIREPLKHNTQLGFMDIDNTSDESGSISSEEETGSGSDSERRIQSRPIADIWNATEVWQGLEALLNAQEIIDCIKNGDEDKFLQNKDIITTGLLICAWLGNYKFLKLAIESGAIIDTKDAAGRTALHLASYIGAAECVKILIENGANIHTWDIMHRITPLHCAASSGNVHTVRVLIQAGADVNAGITGRSPLHYAVEREAIACVEELLKCGACPNTPQVFTETPLHIAAALGSYTCIRLLLEYGAEARVQCGKEKTSALHFAAQDGNADCARLLLDAGANVNSINSRKQTPLHLAALSQSTETLELFLKRGANPNMADIDGRTPLHSAIVKASRCCECVQYLVNAGANVNQADNFGYTPLHIAALNEFSNCVLVLLNHNGDVTARTNGGCSALSFIVRRTPDVIPHYIAKFDQAIKINDHDIGDVDCELKLDFRILVPTLNKAETALLLTFIEVGQRQILKHPLCETFLYFKWKRIRKFFLFSLFYHFVFVILFSGFIIGVFLRNCPRKSLLMQHNCTAPYYVDIITIFLFPLSILLLAKELFQIAHGLQNYVRNWENWLQWIIIISVPLCTFRTGDENKDISLEVGNWQHHIAAIAIFFTWLELMIIVGRFPMFGLYVQMFQSVAINFSKFLITYCCLFIAFGLCFGVLFTNYPPFQNLIWALLKTIIMMSGELEFEDIFYSDDSDKKILYPITAHVLFLAFVLLVTIILTNLLVGLAVSDIQGLQQSAGLDRLVRQAELVAHLESMLFSKLLCWVPKKLLYIFHQSALLLSSQQRWALYIRPNDPREKRIPQELLKNIYNLVVERKERARSRKMKRCLSAEIKLKCYQKSRSRNSKVYNIEQFDSEKISYKNVINEIKNFQKKINCLSTKIDELIKYNQNINGKDTQNDLNP